MGHLGNARIPMQVDIGFGDPITPRAERLEYPSLLRGTPRCPRCGADLEPVMRLVAAAWRLREDARCALRAGDFAEAARLAEAAADLDATPSSRDLLLLAAIL